MQKAITDMGDILFNHKDRNVPNPEREAELPQQPAPEEKTGCTDGWKHGFGQDGTGIRGRRCPVRKEV